MALYLQRLIISKSCIDDCTTAGGPYEKMSKGLLELREILRMSQVGSTKRDVRNDT